ncbi:DUF3408 domain-containing protein [Sphingobacterium lactis]|jgi:hypothetical protein|uniref:Conjugative transposon protein TraB n=4 Tax=Sphingobacterium TaxID=28453 RepID=D7VNM8_SPHSI|nr:MULTISPECIES: DUF3408 domain-containing protein [Sphingobacterium]EFK57525.1 hypothetical protein HMPREF0766_12598 [Sphingobacterium spiritivorum ATCC 33861]MCC2599470.1 DUF3408 domain-containing protein [Sphingobacterium sp. FBM7-1]OYD46640.1 DUF3408 domain-containing protein [Sphingobacterium cellulitidis]QBR12501.1 DUF3408 domain-containing protein [Sphingobacterium sp. CZ-2]QQT24442.1 DUF3408 domain-containing protein [Sphingobacterium spiritivorum]
MSTDKRRKDFDKPDVDEELIMNIMSGNQSVTIPEVIQQQKIQKETKPKARNSSLKKVDYEETFLVNRFPSGRNGKVVYIRPEYHERLLRIVQLTREEKTTLYSYIDNILEHHFREYGDDITDYFNERFKPIL